MLRKEILDTAAKYVIGDREEEYGTPESNFALIANMWTGYTGVKFEAQDVACMMMLVKIARIRNGGGTADSYVDIAGYAACGGEILDIQKSIAKIDCLKTCDICIYRSENVTEGAHCKNCEEYSAFIPITKENINEKSSNC